MSDITHIEKILKEYMAGNEKAFDKLYDLTYKPVYYAIYAILNDKASSEDILQDTYIRAFKNLDKYTLGTNFQGWLVHMGKNLARNQIKSRQREIAYDFASNPSMVGRYEKNNNEYGIIDLAKKLLDEDVFMMVMLIAVEGYKRQEVSQIFNMPISTVTYKYQEAIKKLKIEIEKI